MGLLNSVKNFVTGGGAEVIVNIENPVIDGSEPLRLSISATAKEETLAVKKVYVEVKAEEKSANTKLLYNTTIELEKNVQLSAGENKSWSCEVPIPEDIPATFFGRHSSMQWYVNAGLDVPGMDPDSGWQKFVVNRPITFSKDSKSN
ncbi:MAG: sporulation protein [Cyclobacteriaceae bacterium]